MPEYRPSRRRFLLGAASLAATAGLAGCQGGQKASLEPHLPADRLRESGWRQVSDVDEEATEEVEVAGTIQQVHLETKADVYENDRPTRRLAERFGVDASESAVVPAASFVAAKARVDPPVTELFALSDSVLTRAMDAAEEQVERQLRENGFTDIRRVEAGTLDVEAGATAHHRVYRADYAYESFEVDYEGRPVVVDPGTFTVEAQLGAWPYRGLFVTGAGVYPGEPGHLTVTARGTSRELALGLQPERYRADVRGLIRLVS